MKQPALPPDPKEVHPQGPPPDAAASTWAPPLAAIPIALLALAVAEGLSLPLDIRSAFPEQPFVSAALTIRFAPGLFSGLIGAWVAVGLVEWIFGPSGALVARWPASRRLRWPAIGLIAAAASAFVYETLSASGLLAGHPAALIGVGALWVGMCLVYGWVTRAGRWALAAGLALLAAGVALGVAVEEVPSQYFSIRQGTVDAALVLAHLGATCALAWAWPRRRLRWGLVAAPLAACAASLGWVGSQEVDPALFRRYTAVGQVSAAASATGLFEVKGPLEPDPEAQARFDRLSGLPDLGADFDLSAHNVLVIMAETTRYDATSLATPGLRTTPSLDRLVADGAFRFSGATTCAPSTALVSACVMGMSFFSAVSFKFDVVPWRGELMPDVETAAEVFKAGGYETFAVLHNWFGRFGGFEQGFDHFSLGLLDDREADRKAVDAALERIDDVKEGRFFGWIFLEGPHWPYLDWPPDPQPVDLRERYHREIQAMDAQLGRLIDNLKARGLYDETVIVWVSDHGEEFRGQTPAHGTLDIKTLHVPMVIRVPGVQGRAMDAPTSSSYLMPWLLGSGDAAMRAAASARIQADLGPLMRASEGAVLSERPTFSWLARDRLSPGMQIALIDGKRVVQHDLASSSTGIFDLSAPSGDDLARLRPDDALALQTKRRIEAVLQVSAARRHTILPVKSTGVWFAD